MPALGFRSSPRATIPQSPRDGIRWWIIGVGHLLMALPLVLLRGSWVADWNTAAASLALPLAMAPAAFSVPLAVWWLTSRHGARGRFAAWLVTTAAGVTLAAQAAYVAEFQAVMGFGHLPGIANLPEIADLAAGAMLEPGPLATLASSLLGGYVLVTHGRHPRPEIGRVLSWLLLALVGVAAAQEFAGRRWGVGGFARQLVYDPLDAVARHGFTRLGLFEVSRWFERLRHPLAVGVPASVDGALDLQVAEDPELRGAARDFDLIVLQLESLDPEMLDLRDERGAWVMPFLRSARQEWAVGRWFFAQHSAGGSSDAELATLLSLLPPATHGGLAAMTDQTAARPASLTEKAALAGYETAFLHANRGSYYGRERAHRSLGFDHRWFAEAFSGGARGFRSRDELFYAQALERIDGLSRPTFAYLVSMQCHEPWTNHRGGFDPPALAAPGAVGAELQDLAACQREADEAVRLFVEGLGSRGRLDDTVLVVFGDHRSGVFAETELAMERVPLWIRLPESAGAGAADRLRRRLLRRPMSHLDLAPTLSELLGFELDDRWLGLSALGETEGVAFDNRLQLGRCRSPSPDVGGCEPGTSLDFERLPALLPLMIYSAAVAGG